MAHAGDLGRKLEAIQNVECRVGRAVASGAHRAGRGFSAALVKRSSHSAHHAHARRQSRALRRLRQPHSRGRKSGGPPRAARKFCESEMACEPVLMDGTDLMRVLFEQF